jgi:hypothetical protein
MSNLCDEAHTWSFVAEGLLRLLQQSVSNMHPFGTGISSGPYGLPVCGPMPWAAILRRGRGRWLLSGPATVNGGIVTSLFEVPALALHPVTQRPQGRVHDGEESDQRGDLPTHCA